MHLALDIGRVLCYVDLDYFRNYLHKEWEISLDDSAFFLSRNQKLGDVGLISIRDELRKEFDITGIYLDDAVKEWNKVIKPHPIMNKINKSYIKHRSSFPRTVLLSNMGLEHMEVIKSWYEEYPFLKDCVKYFSCEIGARKPSSLFFQGFVSKYPCHGFLYIDDIQENLDVASKYGLLTKRFCIDDFDNEDEYVRVFLEFLMQYNIYIRD